LQRRRGGGGRGSRKKKPSKDIRKTFSTNNREGDRQKSEGIPPWVLACHFRRDVTRNKEKWKKKGQGKNRISKEKKRGKIRKGRKIKGRSFLPTTSFSTASTILEGKTLKFKPAEKMESLS